MEELASVEEESLLAIIKNLRDLNSRLQVRVDLAGEELLKSLMISSINQAMIAQEVYTAEWFNNSLYSPQLNSAIAKALIKQTKNYPVDDSTWMLIAYPKKEEDNNVD